MAEETKKVSFGFSKLKKSNILVKPVEISKPEIDYVDSFDGAKGKFSYKGNVRSDEPIKKELVIPLIGTRTALDVIRSKLEENKKDKERNNENTNLIDGNEPNGTVKTTADAEKNEDGEAVASKVQLSIDDLAAREIINDLHKSTAEENTANAIVIKQLNKNVTVSEKDAPIDYENIPVNDFGLAMLRGMGWTPETGIGKDQKVVQVVTPKLRPKGLGLGADKVILQQANKDSDLTIAIKSHVKFVIGPHKGKYGRIESMDEDNGRVIVKLALGGTVSVSEMFLIPVTNKEYDKNSKVLNPTAYESFKEPERRSTEKDKRDMDEYSGSRRKNREDNHHRKEKYDRRQGDRDRLSEEEENASRDYRRRPERSSSSDRKVDHKKKKKQVRDDSSDRKHKKSKKMRKKRRKYSSDEDSGDSYNRKSNREPSKNYSSHVKSKKSSHF